MTLYKKNRVYFLENNKKIPFKKVYYNYIVLESVKLELI